MKQDHVIRTLDQWWSDPSSGEVCTLEVLPERLVMLSERLAAMEKFYFPYIERREKGGILEKA